MSEIEDLAVRIRSDKEIDPVRRELAAVIRRELDARRDSLKTWELMYFAQAVNDLHHNLENGHQLTNQWLMLSLVNTHKACAPADERDEAYVQPEDVSWITYELISESLRMTGLESS